MSFVKTIPAAIVGAAGLMALGVLGSCGRDDRAASAAAPAGPDAVAASSAAVSASDAEASAALADAGRPAAGTVANAAGLNQKRPPPTASISERAQAAGDEAPQQLRDKVNAANDAERAARR